MNEIRSFDGKQHPIGLDVQPLPGAGFGGRVRFDDGVDTEVQIAALEAHPERLPGVLYDRNGLLVLSGVDAITKDPELLLRLSRLFGPEVENYHQTLSTPNLIHESVDQILVLSNLPPHNREPPPQPDPPRAEDGSLPVQFPHRRGWHTDQSFRRPPPDISLFYAVTPSPKGQGQTLYANGRLAYEALPAHLEERVEDLIGIHALPWTGRSESAVRAGESPTPLLPHQRPQRQPVVRVHPVTGKRALYLCEDGQMDWIEGPFAGLTPGPHGAGAELLYELMSHITQPRFTYVHEWEPGDLVIHDNRNVLHSATWYDSSRHTRKMWRTTVMGNPGEEYAGEPQSWIPAPGVNPTDGLDDQ